MRVLIAAGMVLALVVTATPAHAQAQIMTGVIQGLVRDSTGAVVPGVTVEANNVETNLTQTRVTAPMGASSSCSCRPADTRSPSHSPASARSFRMASC